MPCMYVVGSHCHIHQLSPVAPRFHFVLVRLVSAGISACLLCVCGLPVELLLKYLALSLHQLLAVGLSVSQLLSSPLVELLLVCGMRACVE